MKVVLVSPDIKGLRNGTSLIIDKHFHYLNKKCDVSIEYPYKKEKSVIKNIFKPKICSDKCYDFELIEGVIYIFFRLDSIINNIQALKKTNVGFYFHAVDSLSNYYQKNINFKKIYGFYSIYMFLKIFLWTKYVYKLKNLKKTFFVSNIDCIYENKVFNIDTSLSVLGYDFSSNINKNKIPDSCCFSGDFSYKPNVEALLFLIKLSQITTFKIFVVGRNIPVLPSYGDLVIVGEVQDVDVEVSKYEFYLSPIFSGAGMKNKIFTAVNAHCKCIVSKESIESLTYSNKYFNIVNNCVYAYKNALENNNLFIYNTTKTYDFYSVNHNWENILDEFYKSRVCN